MLRVRSLVPRLPRLLVLVLLVLLALVLVLVLVTAFGSSPACAASSPAHRLGELQDFMSLPSRAQRHAAKLTAARSAEAMAAIQRDVDAAEHVQADPTAIQHRIALTPNGMTVSWSTMGPLGVTPAVQYGLSPVALTMTATGFSEWYSPSITYFHHVVLNNLPPRTTYYWQVVTPVNTSAPILSFTTALAPGDKTPFVVAINGDLGIGYSDDTVAMLKKQVATTDLFWHIGDMNYADDYAYYKNLTYEQITEWWMSEMTDVWNTRPYMVLPGNHEATCNEGDTSICYVAQRNFTSYRQRFRMPYAESGGPNNMYYSFDYGMVHFISMDTEVDFPNSPEGPNSGIPSGPFGDQISWMEADLQKATANRANVPWIFVGGHRPYYTSDTGSILEPYRQAFEAMFVKYGVDVVFWGHVHWYERMWPTGPNGVVEQQSYNNPTMPVYCISASAGNIEGLTGGSINTNYTAFLDNTHFGVGTMTVHNATHVSMVFVESKSGVVYDEWTLYKERAAADPSGVMIEA